MYIHIYSLVFDQTIRLMKNQHACFRIVSFSYILT